MSCVTWSHQVLGHDSLGVVEKEGRHNVVHVQDPRPARALHVVVPEGHECLLLMLAGCGVMAGNCSCAGRGVGLLHHGHLPLGPGRGELGAGGGVRLQPPVRHLLEQQQALVHGVGGDQPRLLSRYA